MHSVGAKALLLASKPCESCRPNLFYLYKTFGASSSRARTFNVSHLATLLSSKDL